MEFTIKVGMKINNEEITEITRDPFVKDQIDIFTRKQIIDPFTGDRELQRYIINIKGD